MFEKQRANPWDSMVYIEKSNTPKSFDGRCSFCLEEKIQIMMYPVHEKLLNKRCELIARCRHKAKFKLLTNYLKKHRNKLWNKEKKNVSNIRTWKKSVTEEIDSKLIKLSINISLTKIYYINITHKSQLSNLTKNKENE